MITDNYSASKLKSYSICPRQFHYTYDLWLIQKKSTALILGTKYHNLVEKLSLGQSVWDEDYRGDIILKGLVEMYKRNPAHWTVIETEKRFEILLEDENWFTVTIKGFLDRVDTDKTVEFKTTSLDYKQEDIDNFQTDIYILARYMTMWELLPIVYHINNKKKINSKKYVPQIMTVEKSLEDLEDIKKNILTTIKKIVAQEYDPKPWNHCFYCPYGRSWTNNCRAYEQIPRKTKGVGRKKSK